MWVVATFFVFALNTLIEPQLTQPSSLLAFWVLMLLPAVIPRGEREVPASVAEREPARGRLRQRLSSVRA
jgi:hypothetical protein